MTKFSKEIREKLLKNPNIEKVTDSRVSYTLSFKLQALDRYKNGVTCKKIFTDAGIDLSLFRYDYAKNRIRRWKKLGKEGLEKGRTITVPRKRKLSQDEEIRHLKAEISILKKLQASAKNLK